MVIRWKLLCVKHIYKTLQFGHTFGNHSLTLIFSNHALIVCTTLFQVPRSALTLPVFDTALLDTASQKTKEQGANLTLLILPLLMLLPGWAIVLYVMAETLYHNWSHSHRPDCNPVNTPLRLIFDAKCAECVARKQMKKVGRLQDAWSLKVSTRRILNYNYASLCTGS